MDKEDHKHFWKTTYFAILNLIIFAPFWMVQNLLTVNQEALGLPDYVGYV